MSSLSSLTSLLLLLLLATAVPVLSAAAAGGWEPIEDLDDQQVHHVASFAVGAHNNKSNVRLWLMRVKSGESQSQVVQGMNYRLVISASDGAAPADYMAVVWKKLDNSMQLISLSPVKSA